MGIFPKGEDSCVDHGLGRLVEFRFKGPHHSHHRDNVTAPHGRSNLRSRLHSCHAQEGGPRSPKGHVVALDKKKYLFSCTCIKALFIRGAVLLIDFHLVCTEVFPIVFVPYELYMSHFNTCSGGRLLYLPLVFHPQLELLDLHCILLKQ